jgi:hypothetical protein
MLAQIMIFTNLDLVLSRKSRAAEMRTMKNKISNKKIETKETTRVKTSRVYLIDEFSDFQIFVSETFTLMFLVEFPLSCTEPYLLRVYGCSCLGEFVGLLRGT